MSMTDRPVLIVGAGPTGLVLAIFLTRLGVRVRIIDRAAEAGTTSRALAVQARTLEFYHQVRLAESVVAGGVKVERINFWVNGKRAAHASLQHIGGCVVIWPVGADVKQHPRYPGISAWGSSWKWT